MGVWEALVWGFYMKMKTSRESLRKCFPGITEDRCYGVSGVPFSGFLLKLELLFLSQWGQRQACVT